MKKNIVKYAIEAFIVIVLIVIFIIINNKIDDNKSQKCSVYENDGLNIYVENCETDGNSIEIDGWCFRQGANTEADGGTSIPIQVILMDKESEEKIFLNTSITCREDINDIYNDGGNYRYGGFSANKSTTKLDFENKKYEILFYYPYWSPHGNEEIFGYKSGYYIVNGQLEK